MIRATGILLLSTLCTPVWAALTAHLERTQIQAGEVVKLVIRSDQQAKARPDFSALTKDFDVVSSSASSQYVLVNGKMNAQTSWSVVLQPLHEGSLQIPALSLGSHKTQALTLKVTAAAAGDQKKTGPGSDIFVETSLSKRDPYVQEMVLYTVRIFHAIKLLEGELPDPELDQALVKQLEPDRKFVAERNGRRYNVIERRYVVFPLQSGDVALPAPLLKVKVPDGRSALPTDNDPFAKMDPFFAQTPFGALLGSSRSLTVRGGAQVITAKAPPAGSNNGRWVPATALSLQEQYQLPASSLKVGEPITRKITLRAEGLLAEQIPEVHVVANDQYRVYPNTANAQTHDLDNGVRGQKTQQFAFVPTQEGEITLPEIKMVWWDVTSNSQKTASLPARTFSIAAATPTTTAAAIAPTPSLAPAASAIAPEAITAASAAELQPEAPVEALTPQRFWPWVVALLAAVLLAMAAWVYFLSRKLRRMKASRPVVIEPVLSNVEARKQFKRACKRSDAEASRKALIAWAHQEWPDNPPSGLLSISKHFRSEPARDAIRDLELVLFADGGKTWNGRDLAAAIPVLPTRPKPKVNADKPLPELYT